MVWKYVTVLKLTPVPEERHQKKRHNLYAHRLAGCAEMECTLMVLAIAVCASNRTCPVIGYTADWEAFTDHMWNLENSIKG